MELPRDLPRLLLDRRTHPALLLFVRTADLHADRCRPPAFLSDAGDIPDS
jgi:hypothetical protein